MFLSECMRKWLSVCVCVCVCVCVFVCVRVLVFIVALVVIIIMLRFANILVDKWGEFKQLKSRYFVKNLFVDNCSLGSRYVMKSLFDRKLSAFFSFFLGCTMW